MLIRDHQHQTSSRQVVGKIVHEKCFRKFVSNPQRIAGVNTPVDATTILKRGVISNDLLLRLSEKRTGQAE